MQNVLVHDSFLISSYIW